MKGLSNRGWAFIFNKTSRGVGSVAEERRQRAVEIADIARELLSGRFAIAAGQ